MDLTSFRRTRFRAAAKGSAALDYPMLVALLNAAQTGAALSQADAADDVPQPPAEDGGDVIALIAGAPSWRRAILGQGGSFNRGIAERDMPEDPPA
jgi:hypothetical protein